MDKFFKRILNEDVAINRTKMQEIYRIIKARDLSSGIAFLELIMDFADRIDSYMECEERCGELSDPRESDVLACEVAHMRISLCIGILTKYLYPIIEQLETMAEDGIIPADELKERG